LNTSVALSLSPFAAVLLEDDRNLCPLGL
jgi:hypothetical protein